MAAPSESFLHPDREIVSMVCLYPVRMASPTAVPLPNFATERRNTPAWLHLRSPESETDDEDGAGAGAMAHIHKIKKRETIRSVHYRFLQKISSVMYT
ncbi:hypothetical protein ABZP36_009891 [Zizania latifolia]